MVQSTPDGGTDENTTVTEVTVRDALMDAPDWEYTLAGHLAGTDWVHPENGVDTIGKVRTVSEREQGHRYTHPEIVFKHSNLRLPVSGFLRRIDPTDIGDIEPSGRDAKRIVAIQEQHSWRNITLTPDHPHR